MASLFWNWRTRVKVTKRRGCRCRVKRFGPPVAFLRRLTVKRAAPRLVVASFHGILACFYNNC